MLSPPPTHRTVYCGQPGEESRRGVGGVSECGDLISPQQDLGSTLGFSQHNYSGRGTEKESLN